MANPTDKQIAKELMLALMSHPAVRPAALFTSEKKGESFEGIWTRIVTAIAASDSSPTAPAQPRSS